MAALAPRIESIRPLPVDSTAARFQLRLTASAGAQALLGVPALLLAVLSLAMLPTSLSVVGLLLPFAVVPAAERLADLHRRLAGELLGVPVRAGYAPARSSPPGRLLDWGRDPARWRDLAHLWFSATGGFVMSALPVVLLLGPLAHLVLAVVLGGVWWALVVLLSLPMLVAWWTTTPALVRARAYADRGILADSRVEALQRRVEEVEVTRAETLDHSAAEIRRIERDLHDGAQARIAAVGMTVGLAEKLLDTDPQAAAALLREARETTVGALEDLRGVVRGIHPPVLADRGLAGAVEALALSLPLPVTVALSGERLPAPVESAAYFAVAECLANTAKHAEATRAWVQGGHDGRTLRITVGDDGRGGADPDGAGLRGVARRLAAFDGRVDVVSPAGGGTRVVLEVPCSRA